ncbi:MAG TPA: FlgD immunoglobulin-like domain containing protein, partial [Spirochaetia bacterium]|nr:FlgD immunoglobulin-like domain containing protein [Spirochaetia bacterium]
MKKGIMRVGLTAGLVIVAVVWLVSCQTAKPNTAGNAIQTEQVGLAPKGDKAHSTIDFSLAFGNSKAIVSWKVEMVTKGGPQKQWSGDAKSLPSSLSWDGTSESGSLAPEGTYTARLTVDYGKDVPAVTVESSSFILDITPPTGSVSFNPQQLNPDAQGAVQPVKVAIKGNSAVAKLDSWSLDIMDPMGKVFRSFDGKWPAGDVQWDGKSTNGDVVAPATAYSATATLRDEFGLTAQVTGGIMVAGIPAKPVTPVAPPPGTLAVTPESPGFSPPGTLKVEKLDLAYGKSDAVKSWKLEVVDAGGAVAKTFSGDASNMPAIVSWDGTNDSGSMAPEGKYTARLSVDYGGDFTAGTVTSDSFVLDITPPTGSISLSDPLFSPIEGSPTITL